MPGRFLVVVVPDYFRSFGGRPSRFFAAAFFATFFTLRLGAILNPPQ